MMLKLWLRIALVFVTLNSGASYAAGTEKFYENASSNNALLNLLNNSKSSIDIEIYEMEDILIHDAIRAALGRGVKVRIIQEPKPVAATCAKFSAPAANDTPMCKLEKALVSDVRAKGGTYIPFASHQLCPTGTACLEHGKLVISDGKFVFLSTGNFNPTSLCDKKQSPASCNRDYSILTWDPGSVKAIQAIFNRDLAGQAYDLKPILATPEAAKITVSPYSLKPLVEFIRSAKTLIQIENQYLKDPDMNKALMDAAQRGVKVYVMVASLCSFGKPSPSEISNWSKLFTTFDQAGIQSRAFTRKIQVGGVSGYLHAKAILVDSTRAWVGSVNGSTQSLNLNREYGIFINDESEALKLGAFLKSDFLAQDGETWQESTLCKKDFIQNLQQEGDAVNGLMVQ